jgi:hypothetical protein
MLNLPPAIVKAAAGSVFFPHGQKIFVTNGRFVRMDRQWDAKLRPETS